MGACAHSQNYMHGNVTRVLHSRHQKEMLCARTAVKEG